jgi:hypothetical protein
VRSDLQKIPEVARVETDLDSRTCQIVLKDKEYNIKSKLDELAKDNEHLEGWSIKGS